MFMVLSSWQDTVSVHLDGSVDECRLNTRWPPPSDQDNQLGL